MKENIDIDNNVNKNPINYYRDTLSALIHNKSMDYSDINRYISALSFYLCSSDSSYKYNLPYLREKSEQFNVFIESLRSKYRLLEKIIQEAKKESEINDYLSKEVNNAKKINISINNFIQSDLNGNITFCDDVNIKGTDCKSTDAIVTMKYQDDGIKLIRTTKIKFKIPTTLHKKREIDFLHFSSLIKKLIEISK